MFKDLFLTLGTKYERTIDGNYIFVKTERDTSFRQVIITWDLPAPFHHSKNSEIMKISVQWLILLLGLTHFVLNLSDGQVNFFEEFK